MDPSGLQPGRAQWRQKHTLGRRSRLCLGPHWAIWRHFQDHLPVLVRHSGTLCWVRAGLQGRLLGQSPPKSKHGTPHPPGVHLCAQLVDTTELGPSHSYLLVELPPSPGPGPWGLKHRGQTLLSPLPWPPASPAPTAPSRPSPCLQGLHPVCW